MTFCKSIYLGSNSVLKLSKRGIKDVKHYFSGERSEYSITLDGDAYYLCLSTTKSRPFKEVEDDLKQEVISLDPGVRTFMTGYSPDGRLVSTNDVVEKTLCSNFKRIDNIVSTMSKTDCKRSLRNMKKRKQKLFKKNIDVVNNMHIHVAKELAQGYRNVILPEFGTSKMLSEKTLSSVTKRYMGTLSFYKFKIRLMSECAKYKTELKIVTEEYTSKTCGGCGTLHPSLGSNKTYSCKNCNLCIDRDVNGARNILLKHI